METRVSECRECPEWVVRCAHWDGSRMFLINPGVGIDGHSCDGGGYPFTHQEFFQIHLGPDAWDECNRATDCHAQTMEAPCRVCLDFNDIEAANEAFNKREEELLRVSI